MSGVGDVLGELQKLQLHLSVPAKEGKDVPEGRRKPLALTQLERSEMRPCLDGTDREFFLT